MKVGNRVGWMISALVLITSSTVFAAGSGAAGAALASVRSEDRAPRAARSCLPFASSQSSAVLSRDGRGASKVGRAENFRIVSTGPRSERGGMIAWTRLPSGSRASAQGDDFGVPPWLRGIS